MAISWHFASIGLLSASAAGASTYDAVIAGKKCTEEKPSQLMSCEYRIGKDLLISIAGIGQPDTGVTFMKANIDGDYYATFGLMHSCVIVKPGAGRDRPLNFAFISPRTGKVFRTWQDCQGY
jgi:hypothetical protein